MKLIEFSKKQLELIILKLENSIIDNSCISKKEIFNSLSKKDFDMELYQFEIMVTKAVRNGTLPGYGVRPGRGGGIFKNQQKKKTLIKISDKTYNLSDIEEKIFSKILEFARKKESDDNVFYEFEDQINTQKLFESILSGK